MKNILSRIWSLLSSNLFAAVIIVVLAVVSVLGTVVPQRAGPEVYQKLYGEVFSGFGAGLGLFDLYNSPLFILVLSLLGLALLACSLNRLKLLLKSRGRLYSWGSFFAHGSILIIYLGALYGRNAGFAQNVTIEKGSTYFEPRANFYLRLNDFNAKFDASGRPLAFSSDLSVIEAGKEVLRRTIAVNRPLAYKGLKFYQSSYGLTGQLEISGPDGKVAKLAARKGGCVVYPGTGQMFCVAEIMPDMRLLHGLKTDYYEPTFPLLLLSTHDAGEVGWLMKDKPVKWGQYTLKLTGAAEYTGLQEKSDPGVWLVYLGFLLLTAGVGTMLYDKK